MSNLINFNFENQSVRVFLDENKNPLFVATDVASTLGYKRPNDAIQQFCNGAVKHRIVKDSRNRNQEMRVIYEPDVYRLIFGSKLESAIKFQNWVFDEVLPSIRKNGSYAVIPQTKLNDAQQRELANKVRSICQNDRKRYAMVWNGLKEHFKVERYQEIPSVKFAEALGYIDIIALSTFQHDFSSTMPNRELQAKLEHIYDLVELLTDSKLNQMLKNRIHDLSKILA